jgi:histidine triad (HIT) family protein
MTPYDDTNIFAKILRGEIPCHKVYEDTYALAFMDIMPRCAGHVLVIPKTKAVSFLDVEAEYLGHFIKSVNHVAKVLVKVMAADGLTLQQFSEPAGGQVVFHLHFHLLPRMNGVSLKPHTSEMEKPEVLKELAEKIAAGF